MRTKSTGKESVSIGHLHHIARTDIANGQHTGHTLRPVVQVVLCVGANNGLAGCARRSVYALYLAHGHGLQTVRIFIAQIVLGGEGKFGYIIDGLYILGTDALLVHFLLIERYVLIASLHGRNEALRLQGTHLLARHAFYFGIKYHSYVYVYYRLYQYFN